MADLIPCALCGQPAVAYDHDAERNVCDEHDGGFNSPLPQATRMPWPESELARRRESVSKTAAGLHGLETARWFATLDAGRAKFEALLTATGEVFASPSGTLSTCDTCGKPATRVRDRDLGHLTTFDEACDRGECDFAWEGAEPWKDLPQAVLVRMMGRGAS